MFQEFRNHTLAYSILLVVLFVFILLFLGAWPNRQAQRFVALGLGLFYSAWGILTHLHADHISRKIVYEYVGIGILGSVLLLVITL